MDYMISEVAISESGIESSDKSFKWLYDNSQRVGMLFRDSIEEFYQNYIDSPDKMYRYVINPEWAEASKNMRMRFTVLEIDSDYVLIPLKMIDPIGHDRYFSLSMEPISYNRISDNEVKAVNIMKQFDCVKYIAVPELEVGDEVDNNYYNLPEDFKEMDRSKWRSKRGVNKLMQIVDFNPHAELIPGIEEQVLTVNGIWDDIKMSKDKKLKLSKKTDQALAKLSLNNQSLYIYSFSYHEKMIGYSIAVIILDKYIALLSTKQITNNYQALVDYIGEDTEELQMIHRHLSSYMQYMIHKDAFQERGFHGVYNYGDTKIKGLKDFKLDYYAHRFSYNRYSLDDYLIRRNQIAESV